MADDIERLASAVVHRFAASEATARLGRAAAGGSPTLVDRLASAVGQRLAAGSQLAHITPLASAVAKRLAASKGAARLASSATRHFSLDQAEAVASAAVKQMMK